jgi:hypothetical protein
MKPIHGTAVTLEMSLVAMQTMGDGASCIMGRVYVSFRASLLERVILAFREWAQTARVITHLAAHSRNASEFPKTEMHPNGTAQITNKL